MASKIVVFVALVAACNAVPVWFNEVLPGQIVRVGRAPLSYGFGTGFASNIGGVKHASGFGTSFQSGDGAGQAYGSGLGVADGNYAQGVGIASTGNSYPVYQAQPAPIYQAQPAPIYQAQPTYTIARPTYSNALASAQNYGSSNLASSAANSGNGQATSYAQNLRGLGYAPAVSSFSASNSGNGHQNAISSTHIYGAGSNSHSVAASERHGAYSGSTAQTVQRQGNAVQHSGASVINGPGLKAAHSHAVQTGFY